MKKMIPLLLIATIVVVGCTEKISKDKAILDLGTTNFLIPEFLHGNVKVAKELPFEGKVENDVPVKGNLASSKTLRKLGYSSGFNAYFSDCGLISRYEYLDSGKVTSYWVSEIKEGKYFGTKQFKNDTLFSYGKFRYSDNGCLEETIGYNYKNDSIVARYEFENDNNCNYIGFRYFNKKGVSANRNKIKRDNDGRITERCLFNKSDSLILKKVAAYNEKGFCTMEDVASKKYGNVKFTYKYLAYDNHGNWLSMSAFKNDTLVLIIERTYEYY